MNQSIRRLAPHLSFLALAAAVAAVSPPSRAADVTLAAVASSQWTGDAAVRDMGRIEATTGLDAGMRRALVRHARHPDLGSASPRRLNGTVDVAFEVGASGIAEEAAIVKSSQSNALDGATLRAVRRARFEPLPGEPRRYVVRFDYRY